MRKLLLAAALLWAAPVNAAVLTYNYQGQPLVCAHTLCGGSSNTLIIPGVRGSFVIDETPLPGGSITGLTFGFAWQKWSQDVIEWKQLEISGNGTSVSYREEAFTRAADGHVLTFTPLSFNWSAYGILQGSYGSLFDQGLGRGNFMLTFDATGNVASWSGGNMQSDIVYGDPFTRDGFDYRGFGYASIGPGTWTLTGTPTPQPVPLPPALLLFGSALGLTVFANRWRRRRVGR